MKRESTWIEVTLRSLHTDTRVSVCVCLLSHQFVDLANLLFTFSINRIEGCLNNPLVIFMVATLMSKDRSEESLPRCRFAPNRFQIPLFRFVNDPTHPNDERFAPPSHPLPPPPLIPRILQRCRLVVASDVGQFRWDWNFWLAQRKLDKIHGRLICIRKWVALEKINKNETE